MGDYEEIVEGGTTRRLYYLDNGVLYKKQASQPDSVFYLFTDHLGSVVAIVDQNGSEKFRATYDAWGNQAVSRNDIGFRRGYTGHEMLPEFGLINMNGRLYDPQIGRFLSTDNYVQEPWNSQNFNRYSYCLNNPLMYTDPSGELFGIDDVLLLSMAVSMYTNVLMSVGNGESAWKGALRGGISIAAAIAGSYLTNGIGEILGHTNQSCGTELVRAGLHGIVNGTASAANGGSFWNGFATGSVASAVGSAMGSTGIFSDYILPSMALSGGIASQLTGGEFLFGAMDGIGIGLLNHRWEILPDGTPHRILDDVIVRGKDKRLATLFYYANMNGKSQSKGKLVGFNSNHRRVFSTPAFSGSVNSLMTLPAGKYYATQFIDTSENKFSRKGIGFKVIIGPDPYDPYSGRVRTLLRIHPARKDATEGCIGLFSNDVEELGSLERIFRISLQNNKRIPLSVIISGR